MLAAPNQPPIAVVRTLRQLEEHLGDNAASPPLFYGSILRPDYVSGKSDVDVLIFSQNSYKAAREISRFFEGSGREGEKCPVKKIVWTMKDGLFVQGYKIIYSPLKLEICVYNIRDRDAVTHEQLRKRTLPWPVSFGLSAIKAMYYTTGIIQRPLYLYLKRFLLNTCLGDPPPKFAVVPLPSSSFSLY